MKIHWSIDDPFQGWDEDEEHLTNFRKARTRVTRSHKEIYK